MTTIHHAPVIVFAYNRPDHLERCLSSLAACELAASSTVWVFSDGARTETDLPQVNAVRDLLKRGHWDRFFAGFKVVQADSNQGLARSIRSGVSRVLREHEAAIIVEDDLILAVDFLRFINDCLVYFQRDRDVGSVTGYCPLVGVIPDYHHDVMAVPRFCSHGWATWADRWQEIDWEPAAALKIWQDPALRRRFNSAGSDQLYRLRRQLSGNIQTWAILFNVWQITTGRVTIYPARNRVKNTGFDGTGVHCRPQDLNFQTEIASAAVPYRLSHPAVSSVAVSAFHRVYSGSLLGQIKRALLTIKPPRVASVGIAPTRP